MRASATIRSASVRVAKAVPLAAVLLAAVAAGAADFGPHQDPADANPCRKCHDTAKAAPALRGWAGSVSPLATGWGSKPISYLCYMCHGADGGPLLVDGHTMVQNAFGVTAHGYRTALAAAPPEPEGSPQGSLFGQIDASGLPYAAGAELECTTCHNVHVATDRPFLHRTSVQALCEECHGGRVNATPERSLAGFTRAFSTHPTGRPLGDTARANIKAEAGIAANLRVALAAAPNYTLGGHLRPGAPANLIDCQTCHAVHGPTLGTDGLQDLLAVDNTTADGSATASQLCEGCHFGGAAGEQVGSAVLQAGLGAGLWSDHPVDAAGNRNFYPTGATIPATWLAAATPNKDRGAQPFYTGATKTPVCSSCHDTHGGIANTALLRGPQPVGVWGAFSYGDWCFACHTAAQVLPAGHHSVINNHSVALGDAVDSQLSCGDCHGDAGSTDWTAHNGFWTWSVAVVANDSAFCLSCHTADDPTDLVGSGPKGQSFSEPVAYPASHGTPRGTGSHYLGVDSGEFPGVDPKLTAWPTTGYFSSYGPPNTGGGGLVAPAGTGSIICESCHDLLYNDGRANPGSYTSALKAGWQSNLLLEPYADDPPGVGNGTGAAGIGSGLCTGCHAKSGFNHPLTGEIVPMSGLPLRTALTGFADQAGAPGTLSYPNTNALDCDSCHRPHRADTDSDVTTAAHGASTAPDTFKTRHILEVDGPSHRYSPDLCNECHNR
jgi:predicted CXXCH cytochrome family protein